MLRNGDLVECGRGTDHSDAWNDRLCERLSPQTLQTQIIGLKGAISCGSGLFDSMPSRRIPRFRSITQTSVWACKSVPQMKKGMAFRWRMERLLGGLYWSVARRWEEKSSMADSSPGGGSPSPRPDSRNTFGHLCLVFLQRFRESLGGRMDDGVERWWWTVYLTEDLELRPGTSGTTRTLSASRNTIQLQYITVYRHHVLRPVHISLHHCQCAKCPWIHQLNVTFQIIQSPL